MNNIKFNKGVEFRNQSLSKVYNHLSTVKRKTITTSAAKLKLSNKESGNTEELFLLVNNGSVSRYPLRESFLKKLLRWYRFPDYIIPKLNTDTIVAIGNDFLSHIKSSYINVKIEDDDALTILSSKYSEFTDKELLDMCQDKLKIESVTRNDYLLRIYSAEKINKQAIPGDECGYGYNIFNSETGFMAIKVAHYILRYICSNGAIVPIFKDDSRIYHYDQLKEKILEYITTSIENINTNRDLVINRLAELKNQPALKALKAIKMQLGIILGLSDASALISEFSDYAEGKVQSNEYQDDRYSLFNFITHNAKNRSIMERIQMEELAGRLILN